MPRATPLTQGMTAKVSPNIKSKECAPSAPLA